MQRRYALVTAGAQGLGSAIVQHLALQQYGVLIHYYTSQAAAVALQESLRAAGGEAHILGADLSDSAARTHLMQAVAAITPQLHVLVNNLGWYDPTCLPEITLAQWERALRLNCTAAFHLTQLALPLLEAAGAPRRIINLGDSGCDRIAARVMATPYHIAKVGLHILTRSYAPVLLAKGITVNVLSPGFLDNSVGSPPDCLPAGRTGAFPDVLGALDYLLSPQAEQVSGTNLLVSGAWNL